MATVNIRYIVNDVTAAIAFYTTHLGFDVERPPAPGFAILSRGELRLLIAALAGATVVLGMVYWLLRERDDRPTGGESGDE